MTTTVATQLASLLGDDIDRARYLFRDGQAMVGSAREYIHSCRLPRDERTNA